MPNEVHQADLFLPHDHVGRKTFLYGLTVVDVTSCYKEDELLTSNTTLEITYALSHIYRREPLKWPKLLQVDLRREFIGVVSQPLAKHEVSIRRGSVDIHHDQGIVECWSRTLAERLFGHQYAQEMRLPEGERSTEWVKHLSTVVASINGEVTQWMDKKPRDAIKDKRVHKRLLQWLQSRPVGLKEQKIPSGVGVRPLSAG